MTRPAATPSAIEDTRLSPGYRRYALVLLMVIYALNMLDRQIVTILAEPMKADLGLTDGQIGAVSGLAFAVFYSTVGLPMARFADRGDRAWLIVGSLAAWSAFTVICGAARSFPQLVLARMGVGIGEAGCTPAAHSLITEFTPSARLASALAFYSLGIPLGSLLGLSMGGLIVDAFGWRMAFFAAGAPGLLVAVLAAATLREPRRWRPRAAAIGKVDGGGWVAFSDLKGQPAFWLIAFAAALTSFSYYGQSAFFGSLFLRNHSAELAALGAPLGLGAAGAAGLALGLIVGVSAGAGALMGGLLADRAAQRGVAGYARQPMVALLASTPFLGAMPFAPGLGLALAALTVGVFLHALSYGPTFAAVQVLASARSRATASAILFFMTSLIGLGLGPLAVGALSDALAPDLGPATSLNIAAASASVTMLASVACFALAARAMEGQTNPIQLAEANGRLSPGEAQ